jgi:hypothetical protein
MLQSTGHLAFDRQLARWYQLKDHPVQLDLVAAVPNGVRFPLVPAGRRSGKTERFKRFITKQANRVPGMYFAAAPTHDQAKKIFWNDLKALTLSASHSKPPSESDRIIYLPNGSEIHVFGLDKPQRLEGSPWKGGGIDEFADVKEGAWEENIFPALNTVNPLDEDYRAWCWLFGVPEGLNHYYELCDRAENGTDPNFKVFHWKSAEILPLDVIEAAKRAMSKRQFKQEFEASFETASGRVYEDYSKDNYTDAVIDPHEQLCWFHDFNYTPLSSGIGVIREYQDRKAPYLLEEIILTSAVSRQSALEFVDRYKEHRNRHVLIYGDPNGKDGEKHGQKSDYLEMEAVLRDHGWTHSRRVNPSTESIKDGQNAVRAKIRNAADEVSLFVNPQTAPWTHKALATVQLKKGSTFLEEDSDYQHIGTAIRYFIDYEFPVKGRAMQRVAIGGI